MDVSINGKRRDGRTDEGRRVGKEGIEARATDGRTEERTGGAGDTERPSCVAMLACANMS